MSSLFKRSNGVYYVSFKNTNRRPVQKVVSTRLRTKRDAEQMKARLDAGYQLGDFCPWRDDVGIFLRGDTPTDDGPSLATFGMASAAFLATRANLRPTTRERYESIVTRFADYVGDSTPTADVRTADVQAWIDSTPTKPVTANNYRKALSTLFRWLEVEGVRTGDPTTGVRLPRVPSKHARYLSPSDVDAICAKIKAQEQKVYVEDGTGLWLLPIVRANVYLGLRVSELVNVRWSDVDMDRKTLTVRQSDEFSTKAGKDRTLPLSAPVLDVLRSLDRQCEFVFPSHNGDKLTRHYVSRRFKHFARQAELPEWVNFPHDTTHGGELADGTGGVHRSCTPLLGPFQYSGDTALRSPCTRCIRRSDRVSFGIASYSAPLSCLALVTWALS